MKTMVSILLIAVVVFFIVITIKNSKNPQEAVPDEDDREETQETKLVIKADSVDDYLEYAQNVLAKNTENTDEEIETKTKASEIYTAICEHNKDYLPKLAELNKIICILYSSKFTATDLVEGYKYIEKAIDIYSEISVKQPDIYLKDLLSSLELAKNTIKFIFYKIRELAFNKDLIQDAKEKGLLAANETDLSGFYEQSWFTYTLKLFEVEKQLIETYKKLAENEADIYIPLLANEYLEFGVSYYDENYLAEAEEMYNEALKLYKLLAKKDPKYKVGLRAAYTELGLVYKKLEKHQQSEAMYTEAGKLPGNSPEN